ncbi:MAG: neutral zinc metallopeptidase [Myxococcota bacterium]
MRWNRDHESPDIIDRRGQRSGGLGGRSNVLRLLIPLVTSKFGIPGLLVLLVGYGVVQFVGGGFTSQLSAPTSAPPPGQADEASAFVGFVLDDVQDTFQRAFAQKGERYQRAKLVLFTGRTSTGGCGMGNAATGPFYCPADRRVYIDLGFFRELSSRLGAPGDFAQAYVIAHEVGHHVQNLTGISDHVARLSERERLGPTGASVRLELMADCLAGTWAHSTRQRDLLESGDLEESLRAAASIGDDRLQRASTGVVRPETFSHGTSEQRARWFRVGLDGGDVDACDTFRTARL